MRRTATLAAIAMIAAAAGGAAAQPPLAWTPCPGDATGALECSWLSRPLVAGRPGGPKVRLRVMRAPATGAPDERIGTIFLNPGGPGASGTGSFPMTLPGFSPRVRQRFDIATWDPRGIGQSQPALTNCGVPTPARPITGTVDWRAVLTNWVAVARTAHARCLSRSPVLMAHMGSVDAARDLDALRAAVGDARLTFWGMSYGTVIGATYAQMYPSRVRALVLDGNVDPNATHADMGRSSSAADGAFGFFIQVHPWLGPKFTRVKASLDRAPIRLPGGGVWTRWDLVDLTTSSLTGEASWPGLEYLIDLAYTAKFGTGSARAAALRSLSKPEMKAPASDPTAGAFAAVMCGDRRQRLDMDAMWAVQQDVVRHGPVLSGAVGVPVVGACAGLGRQIATSPIPRPGVAGPSVPGIIANATRDPNTPFGWAVDTARAFPAMPIVSYVDGVHIIWNRTASTCVDEPIDRFVLTGEAPTSDLTCPFVMPARVDIAPIGG